MGKERARTLVIGALVVEKGEGSGVIEAERVWRYVWKREWSKGRKG
jgi:hypothetical protein